MNLFGNSLKFTKVGFIRVNILLTVSDSGKGISEEYLRTQLYTPFAQEDYFAPGTGLGLSLVRQVVATLGGGIYVASEVGRGTDISVSLPLPVCEGIDEEQASFEAMLLELAGLKVLVRGNQDLLPVQRTVDGVAELDRNPDDNPINCKILAVYMKKIDQLYYLVENGLEALERFKESPAEYNYLLTDISIPVIDGLESSRRVREFKRAR
ncbi:hypothetical protein NKR19_g2549 [Coniochaeta hoffmannii]|uniref:histidine kinase n=1 Tax=Coniochaeta hoffmannii TaxID=91930 RepID=A0AA38SAF0_9PEZI|nr:hypothetical protein NKR19_g2549 [Coniochaeta hoffmannii]